LAFLEIDVNASFPEISRTGVDLGARR